MSISAAKAAALVAQSGLSIATGDTVTLSDTGAAIAALSATEIGGLAAHGVDKIDASTDALSLTVAQYLALIATTTTLTAADTVTLADTGANIADLSAGQIGALAGNRIDRIDATDNTLTLTKAQYDALGSVVLTSTDAITVTLDAAVTPGAFGVGKLATFNSKLVDVLDVNGGNTDVSI